MTKKLMSLFCIVSMIFCIAGCKTNKTGSEILSTDDDFMSFDNNSTATDSSDGQSSTSGKGTGGKGTTGGGTVVSKTEDGNMTVSVDTPVTPTQKKSILASKDYKGKSFTFMYWYEPDDIVKRKVAAFNKAHNAKVKIVVVTGFLDSVAKSIASGTPYDIVANHSDYFPQSIFSDLYEPLEGYIATEDMHDSSKPETGGISAAISDNFAWGGHYYALGSTKAVYPMVFYYNKKMFTEAGLEDPWELYKSGKWTWNKLVEMGKQVTDFSNNITFLEAPGLGAWNAINAIPAVKMENGTYTAQFTSTQYINSCKMYQELFKGNTPICSSDLSIMFRNGQCYMSLDQTDAYKQNANFAKTNSHFGKTADNLGAVPAPAGPLNTSKAYPGAAPQGYSSIKGAKDPSVAACYALFESTYTDKEISGNQFPTDVRAEVEKLFAANPYASFSGFTDSSGRRLATVINNEIGKSIREGADVNQTINNKLPDLQRIISDSLQNAK